MIKKFADDPKIWTNYASFLFDTLRQPERGRALLPRSLQSLLKSHHAEAISNLARLEFKSPQGDKERGRTLFEGLLSSFPNRLDLWLVFIDLETNVGSKDNARKLFERITSGNLKPQKAKHFFKKWLGFEQRGGNHQRVEMVQAKATNYVRSLNRSHE